MRTRLLDTVVRFLIGLTVMLSFAACGGPSEQQKALEEAGVVEPRPDSPEAAAKAAFETWAKQVGIPYRNVHCNVLSNDGTFAAVRIVAQLRETVESDWLEQQADVECRKVGDRWQSDTQMYFQFTAEEKARRDAAATATRVAIEATRTAIEVMAALEATATAVAKATIAPQVTATAIAQALQELEGRWGASSKCQNARVSINCNVVVSSTGRDGLSLRSGAGYNYVRLALLDEGTLLQVLEAIPVNECSFGDYRDDVDTYGMS
ncbi:MAG: hypothetical protein H8D43_01075 [Chloroflexi bacterium]|nr:hypothetical protein [Chloroflexota bacterium]